MSIPSYAGFLAIALTVVLVPGPDLAVVLKNTLSGGRRAGWLTSAGVAASNAIQGTAAVAGLGALIVRSQPLFEAIKWAGVCYLAYLAVQAARSAWRGAYDTGSDRALGASLRTGYRQGFLSNITNPKVLVFYLAVFPQFMAPDTAPWSLAILAASHAVISLGYLVLIVAGISRAAAVLDRRPVRRTLDAVTATALGAFSINLATSRQ
jgi:threonine/homoserine/homoserine lactone efflux protein